MCDVPVFYATTEGHTRLIAERIAERLRSHGLDSQALSLRSDAAARIEWRDVRGACVAASLHMQRHQREATAFARQHHEALSIVPSTFVSVSLAAASVNQAEVAAARDLAEGFVRKAGWHPMQVASVAGCLAYTKYNWLVRLFLRRIARQEGASTDITRDHVYTDWQQVDQLAETLTAAVQRREILRGRGKVSAAMAS
jgi:menaquinone-dependent protoporphyrinogen oxidase